VEPDLLLLELTEERRHCSVACWEKVSGMACLCSCMLPVVHSFYCERERKLPSNFIFEWERIISAAACLSFLYFWHTKYKSARGAVAILIKEERLVHCFVSHVNSVGPLAQKEKGNHALFVHRRRQLCRKLHGCALVVAVPAVGGAGPARQLIGYCCPVPPVGSVAVGPGHAVAG
jgi:hypothetical protein